MCIFWPPYWWPWVKLTLPSKRLRFYLVTAKMLRTTHPITTTFASHGYLPNHASHMQQFWRNSVGDVAFYKYFPILCGKAYYWSYHRNGWADWRETNKQKKIHRMDAGLIVWPWPFTSLKIPGQNLKCTYLRNGKAHWHGTKWMRVDRML